ncbi:asparagine N-glycosylation enzyme membrane subunit Stt3 [Paenibacillus sp. V4I9]|nr:asparagine N-glycosylation enzyme membrane subunit Stt3 [Paenibacillus sp. V4I9]
MSRRRGIMSESFKYELAKDLGFYDVVQREGWEGIRTKDAGNMVKRAIQIAQEQLVKQYSPGASTINQMHSTTQSTYSQPNLNQTNYSQPTSNPSSYTPSNYNQSTYQSVSSQQTYSQPQSSFNQNVYSRSQQTQSSYTPAAYMPNTTNVNTYRSSNPIQPNAAVLNQIIAGSQQTTQAEQRPYNS